MGAKFRIEHANIVAYLTSMSYAAPRTRKSDLADFLDALAYRPREWLIASSGFESWPEHVSKLARKAAIVLADSRDALDAELLSSNIVSKVFEELRSEFSAYPLFALAVGEGKRLQDTAVQLATAPMRGQLLVLIPEQERRNVNLEVLDPIPAFSVALHSAADWPGIAFWTSNGGSAFARVNEVAELSHLLESALNEQAQHSLRPEARRAHLFDRVLCQWAADRPSRPRRLLHLSDLHFGTTAANENQPLLDAELKSVVKSVDRVVITGDLFDTPRHDYANLFAAFRNNITHLAGGREPISITGNHDQRMIGLFGDNYRHAALIGPTKVIIDDACRMTFICLNSSMKGSLARGKVTKAQLRQVGAAYRTQLSVRPGLEDYLPVVLVHHHPFSFDVAPETMMQRVLSAIGVREERLLEMVDASDLHNWCVDWNFRTILHGHKHKARYVGREIERGGKRTLLTAIGCGSSLGAEGSPVSYNILEWDPNGRRWVAAFFESENGGAFREIATSVSPDNFNLL